MKRHPTTSNIDGNGNSNRNEIKRVRNDDGGESESDRHHSLALESILLNSIPTHIGNFGDGDGNCTSNTVDNSRNGDSASYNAQIMIEFFENTWQRLPTIYKKRQNLQSMVVGIAGDDKTCTQCPLQPALSMGWDGIASMLEKSRITFPSTNPYHDNNNNDDNCDQISDNDSHLRPLFLQNQTPIQSNEVESLYSFNPFAAYIDGCSIIQNHADYFSAPLAELCIDLQKSFPHVYCNTYLTPPNSSTVRAHADDRDVFVVQIKGRKKWKVYRKVPVAYPYSHEQVGKNGIVVPPSVMTASSSSSSSISSSLPSSSPTPSPILMEMILEEGDVLYMPRGYVHEASTTDCNNQPSFHATIAIMTSDWSLSKTISEMTRKCLDDRPKYRMAVDLAIGTDGRKENRSNRNNYVIQDGSTIQDSVQIAKDKLKNELEIIFKQMREYINVETISLELARKYDFHNYQAECMRKKFLYTHDGSDRQNGEVTSADLSSAVVVVGPNAARVVSMSTRIRASTPKERESIRISSSYHNGTRGLTVREDASEALLSIAAHMKENLESVFVVSELRNIITEEGVAGDEKTIGTICDFTLCSFVKCCVDLGVMSIVP